MPIEVLLEDPRWEEHGLEDLAGRATEALFAHLEMDPKLFELAVLGTDDARIAILNADFRGKPLATNVLSFPAEDLSRMTPGEIPIPPLSGTLLDPHHIGDVAIALETCLKEAQEQQKPEAAHVTHLIVHGVLHLLGYDHIQDADASLMEGIEVTVLNELGLPSPYEDEE